MYRILLIGLLSLIPTFAFADLNDIIDATCLVNDCGSGIVYDETEDHYWVMTAGHCIVNPQGVVKKEGTVKFFHDGYESHDIKSELMWHKRKPGITDINGRIFDNTLTEDIIQDLGVVRIKKEDLRGYPHPYVVSIAPENYEVSVGDKIVSSGCPGAKWPTAYKGVVHELDNHTFRCLPTPKAGRSGSGVFDEEKDLLIGISIISDGTVVPVWKIYEFLGWSNKK